MRSARLATEHPSNPPEPVSLTQCNHTAKFHRPRAPKLPVSKSSAGRSRSPYDTLTHRLCFMGTAFDQENETRGIPNRSRCYGTRARQKMLARSALSGDGKRRAESDARDYLRSPCTCVQFHGKHLALQLRLPASQCAHTLISASGST